jgi:chromosome segregation ATPase
MQTRMQEMRDELEAAKAKVVNMEYVVRKAERNLDVSRLDHQQMDKSLAHHVAKIDSLIVRARDMRHKRVEMLEDINGTRRRFKHRAKVSLTVWHVVSL